MRILQINVVYGQGSTGHIVEALHREFLKRGQESYVLFGRGPKPCENNVIRASYLWEAKLWRFIGLFTGNLYGGVPLSTAHIKHLIKKIHPDVVHLHSINGNMVNVYSLLRWLKKRSIKTVITHHSEFMFTGGCGFAMCDKWKSQCEHCPHKREVFGKYSRDRSLSNWSRFQKAFGQFQKLENVYVSPWLQAEGGLSPLLPKSPSLTILNPIDTTIFNDQSITALPAALLGKSYIFFPVSNFLAGNKGTNLLEPVAQALEKNNLSLAVAGAPLNYAFPSKNIINLGFISSPLEMANIYKHAKCTLLISKVESFSMPVAESLCCGVPVVGFNAGGPESFAPKEASLFVPQGDLHGLIDGVVRFSKEPLKANYSKMFDPNLIAGQYLDVYQNLS